MKTHLYSCDVLFLCTFHAYLCIPAAFNISLHTVGITPALTFHEHLSKNAVLSDDGAPNSTYNAVLDILAPESLDSSLIIFNSSHLSNDTDPFADSLYWRPAYTISIIASCVFLLLLVMAASCVRYYWLRIKRQAPITVYSVNDGIFLDSLSLNFIDNPNEFARDAQDDDYYDDTFVLSLDQAINRRCHLMKSRQQACYRNPTMDHPENCSSGSISNKSREEPSRSSSNGALSKANGSLKIDSAPHRVSNGSVTNGL